MTSPPCLSLAADNNAIVISEFMAANTRTIPDDHGSYEDWIEIHNTGPTAVALEHWSLTVHPNQPKQWTFPATNLPPDGLLLIWASGNDQRIPGKPLHTNFRLAREGHYLALRRPDGTVATEFAPAYPPQWPDASLGFMPGSSQAVVFSSPTPGRANTVTKTRPGPYLAPPTHFPIAPRAGQAISVATHVSPGAKGISEVTLHWRTMFQREESVPMTNTGQGIWAASLPAGISRTGQMLRWRISAKDQEGGVSAYPPTTDPRRTSKYLGLVVEPDYVHSALPIYQLFIAPNDLRRAESESGTFGCGLWYDGEFYDNVFVKVRGNSTAGFPKKSHRVEFPADHPFRHAGPGGRVRHTSLMAEWGDPSYLRQHLSFWLEDKAGAPAPFHFPVRVQLNGEFWQLAMHSEVLGGDLLSRHGLDPRGALYKAIGTLTPEMESTGGPEKKTRRREGMEDYQALAQALDDRGTLDARRQALFDRMNLPEVISYLAAARISQEDDDIWANMSLYHDNEGSGEWSVVPFDMNVSWGLSFAHGGVVADQDNLRSHPFFGANNSGLTQGHNRLYDAVVRVPETRQMLLRRMRTLLDRWVQPPDTPPADRVLERHIAEMARIMAPEAILDRRKWGDSWLSGQRATPEESFRIGIDSLIHQFIEPRRQHLYVTHSASNIGWIRKIGITWRDNAGIPPAQEANARIDFVEPPPGPVGPVPGPSTITLTNVSPFAVDLSDWSLNGWMRFKLSPGTVLPVQGLLHVTTDIKAFRQTHPRTRGEPARFVVGNATTQPAGPRSLTLLNDRNRPVAVLGASSN